MSASRSSGSTGNENNFIIDGPNTSDPNTGIVGTELHQYFIKEVSVITGGYQARIRTPTGGVVSIVTKGGGDELHGSVFLSGQPFQLTPRTVGRFGQKRSRIGGAWTACSATSAFEPSGPLKKDKVWFYIGFADGDTSIRQTACCVRPATIRRSRRTTRHLACPSYLSDPALCRGGPGAGDHAMEETDSRRFTELRTFSKRHCQVQFNPKPRSQP